MSTTVTDAPETTEDLEPTPTTRKAAREAQAAQRAQDVKAAKKARRIAKRAAKNAPNPYTVGDHVRYIARGGENFSGGKVTAVKSRDVVVEYASGIDFRLDHRDPGLSKGRFA